MIRKDTVYCSQCKYYKTFLVVDSPECRHPRNLHIDLVTGKSGCINRIEFFRVSMFHEDCGGKLFEKKSNWLSRLGYHWILGGGVRRDKI